MKAIRNILILCIILLFPGCITQFVPQTSEDRDMLVVEGLVTDNREAYTIKLSRPLHLGALNVSKPYPGCTVSVSDDEGQSFAFNERSPGLYLSDPANFKAEIGRFYTLHIRTNVIGNDQNYESLPMELKAVPPIDSLYYEKISFGESKGNEIAPEGCQVLLDTHDPENKCKFYRWEYSETWEFRLPYSTPNNTCWVSGTSDLINIKNTSVLGESTVNRFPLDLISNLSDRLRVKYSMLVNQYSMTEDEYAYWEKLQNLSEQVGGLYDIIPSAIPSNIYCLEDPNQKILGYFSVSGKSSRRLFIKDNFAGIYTPYTNAACIADTIFGGGPIGFLGTYVWVIVDHPLPPPAYRVLTRTKACYDCTLRGTDIRPDFWDDAK